MTAVAAMDECWPQCSIWPQSVSTAASAAAAATATATAATAVTGLISQTKKEFVVVVFSCVLWYPYKWCLICHVRHNVVRCSLDQSGINGLFPLLIHF